MLQVVLHWRHVDIAALVAVVVVAARIVVYPELLHGLQQYDCWEMTVC